MGAGAAVCWSESACEFVPNPADRLPDAPDPPADPLSWREFGCDGLGPRVAHGAILLDAFDADGAHADAASMIVAASSSAAARSRQACAPTTLSTSGSQT